jgi:hypothetical protein
MENYHLPQTAAAREALAATIGADGRQLLRAVEAADLPWLREVAAVQTLRQVWAEPYTDPPGPLRWRAVQERVRSAALIAAPMMSRPGIAPSVVSPGSAIRCTSPKPARMASRTLLPAS